MEDNLIKDVRKYAEICLKSFDSAHGIKHTETVASFAEILGKAENIDINLCIISAFLHDIGLPEKYMKETPENNHGINGSKKARTFLLSKSLNESEINEICEAISTHCFPNIQKTKLAKILWDSDKLSLFSKEMYKNYISMWKNKGLSDKEVEEQIKKEKAFYINTFHTEKAKSIAKENL